MDERAEGGPGDNWTRIWARFLSVALLASCCLWGWEVGCGGSKVLHHGVGLGLGGYSGPATAWTRTTHARWSQPPSGIKAGH